MRPPRIAAATALVPLRVFLGATFFYAGVQKLSDAGFLNPDAPTYIGTQLRGFADGTPGGGLLEPALAHPELAGVAVALAEIAIGVLVVLGFMTRAAAAAGLALNLVLFLTATWHTSPYFLGSDIVFVFAWLPFVLAGADGQPTIRDLLSRRSVGVREAVVGGRELRVPELRRDVPLSRRAMLGHVLGLVGVVTAAAAAASSVARGSWHAPARSRGGGRAQRGRAGGPAGDAAAGTADLGSSGALAPGQARSYADPGTGAPAIAIRTAEGELVGVSAVCTHAGCTLDYRQGRLACPCHGSTFDVRTGAPFGGPARRPLEVARVTERNGRIVAGPLRVKPG